MVHLRLAAATGTGTGVVAGSVGGGSVGGGVGGGGFRNDIIIRGGGPSENVFYLDGIEVPVINHFQTQGSSGGPQGILNVSFMLL